MLVVLALGYSLYLRASRIYAGTAAAIDRKRQLSVDNIACQRRMKIVCRAMHRKAKEDGGRWATFDELVATGDDVEPTSRVCAVNGTAYIHFGADEVAPRPSETVVFFEDAVGHASYACFADGEVRSLQQYQLQALRAARMSTPVTMNEHNRDDR